MCALSGGADSVALLDALQALAPALHLRVVAAHLDHGLRPDSAADADFCGALCARLGVPLEVGRADVRARARQHHEGIEAAARAERYAFLRAVRVRHRAVAIAVAHTRDDQAETVLMRLLRGAGGLGLAAMRAERGDIVRPLLHVSRDEVRAHLAQRGLAWREDPSNADRAFLRNRVRHDLLPYLESQFNPRLRARLATTAALLTDENDLLDTLAEELLTRAMRRVGADVVLSRSALQQAPTALARRALRLASLRAGEGQSLAAVHVERLLALVRAKAPSGRRLPLPGGREAVFQFDEVRLGPRRQAAPAESLPLSVPGRIELPGGWTVSATLCPAKVAPSQGSAHVSAEVAGQLEVRTRRPGDRVCVAGREISLKRFLCQRQVPVDERVALPLVAAGQRVLWMPGQQLEAGACGPEQIHLQVSRSTGRA